MNNLTVIVMPAYNAEKTLKDTFYEIPKKFRENIILVDDQSRDNTVRVAKKMGITSYRNPINLGYGGNQKNLLKGSSKIKPI